MSGVINDDSLCMCSLTISLYIYVCVCGEKKQSWGNQRKSRWMEASSRDIIGIIYKILEAKPFELVIFSQSVYPPRVFWNHRTTNNESANSYSFVFTVNIVCVLCSCKHDSKHFVAVESLCVIMRLLMVVHVHRIFVSVVLCRGNPDTEQRPEFSVLPLCLWFN